MKHYGPEADVWTIGVILYILLSAPSPFGAETQQGIFDAVSKGYIEFDSDPWPIILDAKDLIQKMLCSRRSDRLLMKYCVCLAFFLFVIGCHFNLSNLDGYLKVGQPHGDWLSALCTEL